MPDHVLSNRHWHVLLPVVHHESDPVYVVVSLCQPRPLSFERAARLFETHPTKFGRIVQFLACVCIGTRLFNASRRLGNDTKYGPKGNLIVLLTGRREKGQVSPFHADLLPNTAADGLITSTSAAVMW